MHLPSPRALCHWPSRDPGRGLGRKGSDLAGSEDSEEWVEEGGHQGCSSKRHGLRHPVHSSHGQHIGTRSLLEGEGSGRLVTGTATATEQPDEPQGGGSSPRTQTWTLGPGPGGRKAGPGQGVWWVLVGPIHGCVM